MTSNQLLMTQNLDRLLEFQLLALKKRNVADLSDRCKNEYKMYEHNMKKTYIK